MSHPVLAGRLRRDWILLGIALTYTGYLSYAILRLLASFLAVQLRVVLIVGWSLVLLTCAGLVLLVIFKRSDRVYATLEGWGRWVQTLNGRMRGLIYLAWIVMTVVLVYTNISYGLMDNNNLRPAVLLVLFILAVQFWPFQTPRTWAGRFLITLLAGSYALLIGDYLQDVVNYPFSLSWSEANRFYDYSITFGKYLYHYDGNLSLPYFAPGRYGLWGIWFLIPGLPITFHRFWDAFLWIVPPFLLGWLLGRSLHRQPGLRLGLALWMGLFFNQGPIYAPLLLAAALVVGFDRSKAWVRYLSIAVASLYGGMSRWTWFAMAGAWSALLELTSHTLTPNSPLVRRITRVVGIVFLGSLPGVLANWTQLISPKDIAFPLSQPKLWYRLWPNTTYELGIVPGLALATAPLLVIMVWLVISRRWRLDWLQMTAIGGVMVATLGVGLVASVKIGGGSNLHNMDMFLITLGFLVMIYLDQATVLAPRRKDNQAEDNGSNAVGPGVEESRDVRPWLQDWPTWAKGLVLAASFLLIWPHLVDVRHLELPPKSDIEQSLDGLRGWVTAYKSKGEVLFMDQRQLLTFGYIQDMPLIPEYEKKYLMDQSMAANTTFFQDFYSDLARKRFALIVSEPLYKNLNDASVAFNEENDAWVKWVSKPVLCYYTPIKTYRAVRVQLLVPRVGDKGCKLLQP